MTDGKRYRPKARHKDQTSEAMQEAKLQVALACARYEQALDQHLCHHEVEADGPYEERCTVCGFYFLKSPLKMR